MRQHVLSCRLAAIVAHLREQLPATVLVLAGVLPRGFGGDWIGQWQTRRQGAGDFDWPNPFTKVGQRAVMFTVRLTVNARCWPERR